MTFSIWAKLCELALRMFFTRPASLKILPIALRIAWDILIETLLRLVNDISSLISLTVTVEGIAICTELQIQEK